MSRTGHGGPQDRKQAAHSSSNNHHVDVLGRELSIGDPVIDDDREDENTNLARVMRLADEPADEFVIEALGGGEQTVFDTNPEYPANAAVVGVCFESWLKKQDETYARHAEAVWSQARDPAKPNTPEGFAEQYLDEHGGELKVYHFPSTRLRRADGRDAGGEPQ